LKTIGLEKLLDKGFYRTLYENRKDALKSACKKVITIIISLALALGVGELFLRYYAKHSDSPLLIDRKKRIADFLNSRRYFPYEILFETRCNSEGFFDEQEFVVRKEPGIKRVVAIADSFGCMRIPCAYQTLTKAEKLDGESPCWEIYNMSVNDASPEEYLYLLRKEGLTYKADFFLVGFFIGNDLELDNALAGGDHRQQKKRLSDRIMLLKLIEQAYKAYRIYKMYKAGYLGKKAVRLFELDPFGSLLVGKGEKRKRLQGGADSGGKEIPDAHSEEWWQDISNESPVYPEETYIAIETRYFNGNLIKTDSPIYTRVKEIFREMKELTGGRLAVVLFPDAYQVDDLVYDKILSNKRNDFYEEVRGAQRHFVYDNMKALLEELRIPVIDLFEPIRRGQREYERVYYLNDTHFNYWGNEIAAKEIKRFLKKYFSQEKGILKRGEESRED